MPITRNATHHGLGDVVVNEWGEPELTTRQETFLHEAAEQAGCEHAETCDDLDTCEVCGLFVCSEHGRDVVECAENAGHHHGGCWRDCSHCRDSAARDAELEHATAGRGY